MHWSIGTSRNNYFPFVSILKLHFQGKQLCHFHFYTFINEIYHLKERISSSRGKFFLLSVKPLLTGFILQGRICDMAENMVPIEL